jgi:membrane associated rhomboid family serine protease
LLPTFIPVLTANYLHHDVGHFVGNMLVFWVFSNVLVPLVGRQLFLVMYVFGGVIAVVVYVGTNPTSEVAMIGASGAVAALEGAFFTLAFRWRVPSGEVWPFTDWSLRPRGLALLAGLNFVLDTGSFINHSREHVAFGAHVGGFLGGVAMAIVVSMLKTPKLTPI